MRNVFCVKRKLFCSFVEHGEKHVLSVKTYTDCLLPTLYLFLKRFIYLLEKESAHELRGERQRSKLPIEPEPGCGAHS